MPECLACGERWLDWEFARRLDVMLDAMLAGDVEVATRHYHDARLSIQIQEGLEEHH
jgi:hypothetical protein